MFHIIKCIMRTNVFRKGNWKQLPIYLGKKYIVDVFVQNEEQFKICRALKIIKTEHCFPPLQGTVSGVKLVMSPGLLAYFHLHQLSADTRVKTHRVRLLTLLLSKTLWNYCPWVWPPLSFLHHYCTGSDLPPELSRPQSSEKPLRLNTNKHPKHISI